MLGKGRAWEYGAGFKNENRVPLYSDQPHIHHGVHVRESGAASWPPPAHGRGQREPEQRVLFGRRAYEVSFYSDQVSKISSNSFQATATGPFGVEDRQNVGDAVPVSLCPIQRCLLVPLRSEGRGRRADVLEEVPRETSR